MKRNWRWATALLLATILVAFALGQAADGQAENEAPLFSTWEGHLADADTCATAWLIKRFAVPNARFAFAPVGEMNLPGTPFDVPQADLRVAPGKTTFEATLEQYKLNDAPLLSMARIVRDIELNKWGEKATEESRGLESLLRGAALCAGEGGDQKLLELGSVLFDCLYADLRERSVK